MRYCRGISTKQSFFALWLSAAVTQLALTFVIKRLGLQMKLELGMLCVAWLWPILCLHVTCCSTSLSIDSGYCCDRSATSVNKLEDATVGKQAARHCECPVPDMKCRAPECACLFAFTV